MAEVGDLEEALKDHEQARSLAEDNNFLQSSLGADILVNMGIAKAWCHETRCFAVFGEFVRSAKKSP